MEWSEKNLSDYDLHVHTFFSDGQHDFDVILEGLIDLGIKIVGITDHLFPISLYHHSNSKQWRTFYMYSKKKLIYRKRYIEYLDKKYPEIKILNGAEINCIVNGHLTIPNGISRDFFDFFSISRHTTVIKPLFNMKKFPDLDKRMWKKSPYRRWIKYMWKISLQDVFKRYRPDILCHPTSNMPMYLSPKEIEWFMMTLKRYGVSFELNHFYKDISEAQADLIIKYGKKHGVLFSLGSDFHGFTQDPEKILKDLNHTREMYKIVEDNDLCLLNPLKFLN